MMPFSEKLSFLIHLAKTTNKELAAELSVDPSLISLMRTGKRKLFKNPAQTKKMASFFCQTLSRGVPAASFVRNAGAIGNQFQHADGSADRMSGKMATGGKHPCRHLSIGPSSSADQNLKSSVVHTYPRPGSEKPDPVFLRGRWSAGGNAPSDAGDSEHSRSGKCPDRNRR